MIYFKRGEIMYKWKVVPPSDKQKLDINKDDLLFNDTFRKCNTYKGGGGYDKFPYICEKRLGKRLHQQFVVQLYGCSLRCPYCYVTPDGIWGEYKNFTSQDLMNYFIESKQDIFHLMGGSPGLYIEHWNELINLLPEDKVFHSDLLLVEKIYEDEYIQSINKPNCLYAVSIKGYDEKDFYNNTNAGLDRKLFWNNFNTLVKNKLNFYLTFTNCDKSKRAKFIKELQCRYGDSILEDSFEIDLIKYEAII